MQDNATIATKLTPLKSSPEPKCPCPWKLIWGIGSYGPTNCVQIMTRDYDLLYRKSKLVSNDRFTCVALAKAGLVVGPLRPSVCSSVRLPATLLGSQVCAICNSKSFYFFLFKLCILIIHTLKLCTSYFVHISYIFFSILRGVELRNA